MTDESRTLSDALRDSGYTPGVRDVPQLLERWRETVASASTAKRRKLTKLVVQALGRADRPVASLLLRGLWDADAAERGLRVRVLSRIAARIHLPELEPVLTRGLTDPDPRVVRAALRAVGKLDGETGERFEGAVIAHLRDAALPEQRAAAEALGKIGRDAALAALESAGADDGELARRCAAAIELIERRQRRREPTAIVTSSPLPESLSVVLRCRPGTAPFAKEQVCALLGHSDEDVAIDPLGVALPFAGSLEQLYRVRIALDAALAFELLPGRELAQQIAQTLSEPRLLASLRAWSRGPLRFRLAFSDGRARRSVVRSVASALTERDVPIHNDSREAPWSVLVDIERARLLCAPKVSGSRFPYQRARIAAASHPTLAALLAWAARPRPEEVVWDPFCGTGSELIECALLEPSVRLYGTDVDADALAAAAQNLEAAGLAAEPGGLVRADALQTNPGGADATVTPSLIITNPPMGRRVVSDYGVHALLRRFVARAAALLRPGGRLVWVTPAARVSADAGRDAGLRVIDHGAVDLAGLRVDLQVMVR